MPAASVFGQMPWTIPYLRRFGRYSPIGWVKEGMEGRLATTKARPWKPAYMQSS
jgi:hypothetical protein